MNFCNNYPKITLVSVYSFIGFMSAIEHFLTISNMLVTINTEPFRKTLTHFFNYFHVTNIETFYVKDIFDEVIYYIWAWFERLIYMNNFNLFDYSLPLFILYIPLGSAIANIVLGHYLNKIGSLLVNSTSLLISLTFVAWLMLTQNYEHVYSVKLISTKTNAIKNSSRYWIDFLQNWELSVDFISITMCLLVITVSFLVNLYAYNYLLLDPHIIRFFSYLNFFTFFMLFLVCSNNLIQFFFAWEGVGICSYLLIGFWSTRLQAIKSATKAVILNRIGDISMLFAIVSSWNFFGINYFTQYKGFLTLSTVNYYGGCFQFMSFNLHTYNNLYILTLFFCVAAVAKSAQIGLHTWLPDAMEGPTPVSALIHAATMVTAGIFLILKISCILIMVTPVLYGMIILGTLTALFSGYIACVQTDIKKIIAYSTCSQLGYMFFACGLTLYSISLFHLISHGFFKALLFLVAGSFIHLHNNEQSILKLFFFETIKLSSIYSITLFIGLTSLAAIPFFSGFYSKEAILLMSVNTYIGGSWVYGALGYNIGTLAAILTIIYSSTMLEKLLFANPKKLRSNQKHNLIPLSTIISLITLSIFSVFFGFFCKYNWYLIYNNFFFLEKVLNFWLMEKCWITLDLLFYTDLFSTPLMLEIMPLLSGLLLTNVSKNSLPHFSAKYLQFFNNDTLVKSAKPYCFLINIFNNFIHKLKKAAQNKFWIDYIINNSVFKFLSFSYFILFKTLDKGILETLYLDKIIYYSWFLVFFTRFFNYNILKEGFIVIFLFICIVFIFFI